MSELQENTTPQNGRPSGTLNCLVSKPVGSLLAVRLIKNTLIWQPSGLRLANISISGNIIGFIFYVDYKS